MTDTEGSRRRLVVLSTSTTATSVRLFLVSCADGAEPIGDAEEREARSHEPEEPRRADGAEPA